jgi:hypothetical protein
MSSIRFEVPGNGLMADADPVPDFAWLRESKYLDLP